MTDPLEVLARSRALWNRGRLELESDEVLAPILDRGALEDWRALYQLLTGPREEALRMRCRVHAILFRVPTAHPWFWLSALESLGHLVDRSASPKVDPGWADL